MKITCFAIVAAIIVVPVGLKAVPLSFCRSSSDVKEYIVDSITNYIRSCDVVLVQRRFDEFRHTEYLACPCAMELGLSTYRCVDVLKGDESVGGYKAVFLYAAPRVGWELPIPRLVHDHPEYDFGVWENGKSRLIKGKELWTYLPPYDPYHEMWHEYVELRLVVPVRSPIMNRVRFGEEYYIGNEVHRMPASENLSERELMKRLGVENVFSNRVFQALVGSSFQVDYPVPQLEWEKGLMTKEDEEAMIKSYREEANASIMHLSPDEASEIVYLAYLADKRYTAADYDAACKRCPKLLKPVKEFKTEIGKRLKSAMEAGGMLPKK